MEGDGGIRGMIAVVQGLQDAGLAVTLLSRRYCGPENRPTLTGCHEFATGVKPPSQTCHTAIDIATETCANDCPKDMYRSTYQMAHCQTSRFSPKRFHQYSAQGFPQFRSSVSRSSDEEAFVESLRKYPMTPIRSRSADLIERMLTYTQFKNGSRYSNTRSAKSLPSKDALKHLHYDEIPTRDTGNTTNESKLNFGYKRDVELSPVPTCSKKSRYNNQIGMYDYLKTNHKDKKLKTEVRYLTNVKQCIRERLRQICDEEVAPTTICPKIQSRYSQHRRQHHRADASQKSQKANDCNKLEKCTNCQQIVTQDTWQNEIQTSPRECKESIVNKALSSFKHSKACFCDRPEPCDCRSKPSKLTLKPKYSPENIIFELNKHKQCIPICEYQCNKNNDVYIIQLKKKVYNWLQELPVYLNYSTKDAMKREEVTQELIDTLGKLEKNNTYFEKAEYEIKRCLKLLPMWRPENKLDQESFENQLAQSLLQKILICDKDELKHNISEWFHSISFTCDSVDKEKIICKLNNNLKSITTNRPVSDKEYKDILKSEIITTLNELPIRYKGSRCLFINNIADNLINKLVLLHLEQSSSFKNSDLKTVAVNWIKDNPQISDIINVNNEENIFVNELIKRLNNFQDKNISNIQERMKVEVTDWLNFIEEKKKSRIEPNIKRILTSQLISKLLDLHQWNLPIVNLNDVVQKWFDEIPDYLGLNSIDGREDLEMLAIQLQNICNAEDEQNQQNSMRQEILKWLHNLQKQRGKYVDSDTQENLINKLLFMIRGESKVQNNVVENNLITQKIWEWLESQPEFKQNNSLQYRDMIIKLSEKLQDIRDKKGDLIDNDVGAEVTKWFEKLSEERGIEIDSNNRKMLLEKLLSSINPTRNHKFWMKPNSKRKQILKEVSDMISDTVLIIKESDKELLKNQITQVLMEDLDIIHTTENDELSPKIATILKQATNLPDKQITSLAQKLSNRIKQAILPNFIDTLEERPFIFDVNLKNKLKNKVENILKTISLNEQREIIDRIAEILVKNCEKGKNDSDFQEICEILKKNNINESDVQEMTNKLLDMSLQLRNELSNIKNHSASYESGESLWVQKQIFMQRLEREITDFMEKVINESSSFYKEKHSEDSINEFSKLKNPPLKTSTPTKLDSGQDVNLESMLKNEIKEILRKWITSLDTEGKVDETFINEMINDIAADIIDRERYIKLSKMKRSSQEELEHLKYEVFKWTSRLPNLNNLTTTTSKIKMLVKTLDTVEIPNLIVGKIKPQSISTEHIDSGSSVVYYDNTQDTREFLEENIYDAIINWINETSTLKPKNSQEKLIMTELITELSKNLKKLLSLDRNIELSNVENFCKDEITNCLTKVDYVQINSKELHNIATELINYLKSLEFFANILERKQKISSEAINQISKKDAIKGAVQRWCQTLPFKTGNSYDNVKDIIDNLADAISRNLLITNVENLNTFMNKILSNLRKLPLQFDKEDSKKLPEFSERLIETLKGVLNDSEKYYNNAAEDLPGQKPALKKATEVMYDNIQNWCDNLPIHFTTNEGFEESNSIKQHLAAKLLKKVCELNFDPEIFHDDYLYEDILHEEIEIILESLPKTKELEELLPNLKENLIKNLLEAKEGMKNEIEGFVYKQHLRDAISKTLSSIGLSVTQQTSFEILKDNLAGAFISLHYVGDDETLKNKFKDKIFIEVNKFCDHYLNQNPSSPLNAYQLNRELYNALKNVPVPKDESMRREVEQIRIKDVVTDWFKDLPLEDMPSHIEENKIISILAKKLHDIENEADFNPEMDIDQTMNNEILKWLKKVKLKSGNESGTESAMKSLIDKLKATKHSRKLTESKARKSINYEDLLSTSDNRVLCPPSSLSEDDQAYLQKIKDRTSTEFKSNDRKDASVSPVQVTTGIQTEENSTPDNFIFQKISQNASVQTINRDPAPPTPITPQVIVKEYYWDSHGSPTMQRSGSISSYMQQLVTHSTGCKQQQGKVTQEASQVNTASQTISPPISKATITQEASFGQIIATKIKNNNTVGTAPQDSSTATATAHQRLIDDINIDSNREHHRPDDYLQMNLKKGFKMKLCPPCRERAVAPTEFDDCPAPGTSKAFQQAGIGQHSSERINSQTYRPESCSEKQINDINKYCNDGDEIKQPCFRQPIYQTDVEGLARRKRRNVQSCTCRNRNVSKCTIRPQLPCQHSNKSCYVTKKHCSKCWDGFCPHPSYLYFRQD